MRFITLFTLIFSFGKLRGLIAFQSSPSQFVDSLSNRCKWSCWIHQRSDQQGRMTSAAVFFSPTALQANKGGNNTDTESFEIENPLLLQADILAIAIGMQLLGLLDVLNDPSFWKSGGWLQSVSMVSSTSTLPILIQRFSISTIAWGSAGIFVNAFSQEAFSKPFVSIMRIALPFAFNTLLLESVASFILGFQLDFIETIQLIYFSAIMATTARYLLSTSPYA